MPGSYLVSTGLFHDINTLHLGQTPEIPSVLEKILAQHLPVMKKATLVLGIVSSVIVLIGGVFKILHWPGAGIALTIGIVLFFAYAIFLFGDKQGAAATTIDKISNVFVLIAMVLISGGFLFKMMHWPGAGVLIYISNVALFALIPVIFIKASKETEPLKKLNFYNEAIVLILLISFTLFLLFR